MFSCLKTFILMRFFVNSLFFSFGVINLSLGELGCLIRIISSLRISVHGSAYRPHHVRGSSTRYNPYPTPTHLITNSTHLLWCFVILSTIWFQKVWGALIREGGLYSEQYFMPVALTLWTHHIFISGCQLWWMWCRMGQATWSSTPGIQTRGNINNSQLHICQWCCNRTSDMDRLWWR